MPLLEPVMDQSEVFSSPCVDLSLTPATAMPQPCLLLSPLFPLPYFGISFSNPLSPFPSLSSVPGKPSSVSLACQSLFSDGDWKTFSRALQAQHHPPHHPCDRKSLPEFKDCYNSCLSDPHTGLRLLPQGLSLTFYVGESAYRL